MKKRYNQTRAVSAGHNKLTNIDSNNKTTKIDPLASLFEQKETTIRALQHKFIKKVQELAEIKSSRQSLHIKVIDCENNDAATQNSNILYMTRFSNPQSCQNRLEATTIIIDPTASHSSCSSKNQSRYYSTSQGYSKSILQEQLLLDNSISNLSRKPFFSSSATDPLINGMSLHPPQSSISFEENIDLLSSQCQTFSNTSSQNQSSMHNNSNQKYYDHSKQEYQRQFEQHQPTNCAHNKSKQGSFYHVQKDHSNVGGYQESHFNNNSRRMFNANDSLLYSYPSAGERQLFQRSQIDFCDQQCSLSKSSGKCKQIQRRIPAFRNLDNCHKSLDNCKYQHNHQDTTSENANNLLIVNSLGYQEQLDGQQVEEETEFPQQYLSASVSKASNINNYIQPHSFCQRVNTYESGTQSPALQQEFYQQQDYQSLYKLQQDFLADLEAKVTQKQAELEDLADKFNALENEFQLKQAQLLRVSQELVLKQGEIAQALQSSLILSSNSQILLARESEVLKKQNELLILEENLKSSFELKRAELATREQQLNDKEEKLKDERLKQQSTSEDLQVLSKELENHAVEQNHKDRELDSKQKEIMEKVRMQANQKKELDEKNIELEREQQQLKRKMIAVDKRERQLQERQKQLIENEEILRQKERNIVRNATDIIQKQRLWNSQDDRIDFKLEDDDNILAARSFQDHNKENESKYCNILNKLNGSDNVLVALSLHRKPPSVPLHKRKLSFDDGASSKTENNTHSATHTPQTSTVRSFKNFMKKI